MNVKAYQILTDVSSHKTVVILQPKFYYPCHYNNIME